MTPLSAIAAAFIFTHPITPQQCDSIELRRSGSVYELAYINSENHCSMAGEWELSLDSITVLVRITATTEHHGGHEFITVRVVNDALEVVPNWRQSVEDNGAELIFYLLPRIY